MNVFEYATLRVVPQAERAEAMNVGVVLYCQAGDFLGCATHLDPTRLHALDPTLDLDGVRAALLAITSMCTGGTEAGQATTEPQGARFRWLTAPRSTVVQPGPVHPGLTEDPAADLARLLDRLVRT